MTPSERSMEIAGKIIAKNTYLKSPRIDTEQLSTVWRKYLIEDFSKALDKAILDERARVLEEVSNAWVCGTFSTDRLVEMMRNQTL